jgi:uncharacterized protein
LKKFINRLLALPADRHFFLFGARNTGKSTLLWHAFGDQKAFWIDLLDPELEDRYGRDPNNLKYEVNALDASISHVVIDEIQKIPKLLDVVHHLIETTDKTFVMTGSSPRKLKYGGSNLLAGRAFVYHLHPFSFLELGEDFELDDALRWGTLPAVLVKMTSEADKIQFLQAYAQTYLKEEIWLEQFIRKIDPFRKFLEVAAQGNGQILNYAAISRDVGVDDKTIRQYYAILEDTLMGFMLEPFQASFRKRLQSKPKFYFFDPGVCRALTRLLSIPLKKSTTDYGNAFEHFILLECIRLASYSYPEYRFSYLKTKDDVEIDLIVERPGQKLLCIEIKSSDNVQEQNLSAFAALVKDLENSEAICISRDPRPKKIGTILVLPWKDALRRYFTRQGG